MKKFNELWSKIEKQVIYFVLFIFLSAQIVSNFIPKVDEFINGSGNLILISFILLFIFKYIEERLAKIESISPEIGESFGDSFRIALKDAKEINNVDIFAHTGGKYYLFFKDEKIKIKKLRLLLCGKEWIQNSINSTSKVHKKTAVQELSNSIEKWNSLKKAGFIEELEIYFYNHQPSFHFMTLDKNKLFWGLYAPTKGNTGIKTLNNFIFNKYSYAHKSLLNDLTIFFDSTIKFSDLKH
ncbi:MAG: hypothetical protein Q8M15_08930 [Bacteroidota bacterium]|nr:hypothetical protein [Bacteroidota bacterium]